MTDPGPERYSALPLTRRQLTLMWFAWTVATGIGFELAWLNSLYVYPFFTIASITHSTVASVLQHISEGLLLGLFQAFVLRHFLHRKVWLIWPVITATGMGVAKFICVLCSIGRWHHWPFFWIVRPIGIDALTGLLVGIMQFPLCERCFRGRRWLLWPIITALGWMIAYLSADVIVRRISAFTVVVEESGGHFIGLLLGGFTGIAFVLMLRGVRTPPSSEEVNSS